MVQEAGKAVRVTTVGPEAAAVRGAAETAAAKETETRRWMRS